MSLFNRLLAIIFGIGIIPIIPTAFFLFYYQSVAKDNILSLHKNVADMAAAVIESEFGDIKDSVREFASALGKTSGEYSQEIEKFVDENEMFVFAAVLDSGGVQVESRGSDVLKRRFGKANLSGSSLFNEVKKSSRTKMGEFEIIYDLPIVVVLSPLGEDGFLMGVVNLTSVFSRFSRPGIGINGKIFLADFNGNILRIFNGLPKVNPQDLREILERRGRIFDSLASDKAKFVGAYSVVENFSTAVLVLEDRWRAFRGVNLMTSLIAFFLLAVLTVFYFSALFLSRRIMIPVQELIEGAHRVSRRDFSKTLSGKTEFREFATLMAAFNQMTAEMGKYQEMQVEKVIEEKKKMDLLMSMMDDAVILSDLRGHPLYMNSSSEKLLGAERGGENLREKIHDIIRRRAGGEVVEFRKINKFYKVMTEITGRKTGGPAIFIVLRDVTLEREMGKMKEDFFHSVAHDVRLPLLTMQGYIKLLEKACESEKISGYAANIKNSSKQLFEFLQNILDISRFEAGGVKINPGEIKIMDFIGGIRENLKILYDEKGVALELVPGENFVMKADESLLRRVVENILSNSLKFTERGGRVEIRAWKEKKALLRISDTGCGVDPENAQKIFDKYFQVSSSGGVSGKGSGLGLAIAKKIVEAHGGRIWVESRKGKGSDFYVEIP